VSNVQELRRFESIVRRGELAALQADVGTLRTELLRVQDELEASQVGKGLGVCLGSAVWASAHLLSGRLVWRKIELDLPCGLLACFRLWRAGVPVLFLMFIICPAPPMRCRRRPGRQLRQQLPHAGMQSWSLKAFAPRRRLRHALRR
jgi:hypothetical protein